jgi:[citrate (pro-3S)-lyase] ligase
VDFLVIFVVREDKSFFPFVDRIDLVERGIADLPNVAVTESGEFIISTTTFTEYFNKAQLQDMTIDATLDITLFAREIAPCLNILVRFVGSEPFDKVTAQYNRDLSALLPRYGIDFVELPRIRKDGDEISASRVRKLLEEKNFEEIRNLVPNVTYEYLIQNYKNSGFGI